MCFSCVDLITDKIQHDKKYNLHDLNKLISVNSLYVIS